MNKKAINLRICEIYCEEARWLVSRIVIQLSIWFLQKTCLRKGKYDDLDLQLLLRSHDSRSGTDRRASGSRRRCPRAAPADGPARDVPQIGLFLRGERP